MFHLESFSADRGGTETLNAIRETIERRYTDIPLEVMLLTDGDIRPQQELFSYVNEEVAKSKGDIRIFPLGIGHGVSHALIEGVARAGNGFAQSTQDGERLENRVFCMLRGALSPHIMNYSLEIKYSKDEDDFELTEKVSDGVKVLPFDKNEKPTTLVSQKPTISLLNPSSDSEAQDIMDINHNSLDIPFPKLLQAPHKIPPLFPFSRSVVYLLMSPSTIRRNPTSVIFRATSIHGPLEPEIPIEALPAPAETIHQLLLKRLSRISKKAGVGSTMAKTNPKFASSAQVNLTI